jgi:hypothetical protein
MKKVILFSLLVFLTLAPAANAQIAVNTTTNSVIFLDYGFEDDAVGSPPGDPHIGSWVHRDQPVEDVTYSPYTGAYEGDNFLRTHNSGVCDMVFSEPVPLGESVHIEFALINLHWFEEGDPDPIQNLCEPSMRMLATGMGRITVMNNGAQWWNDYWYNYYDGGGPDWPNTQTYVTPIPAVNMQWQIIEMDYTVGLPVWTFTVDGVSDTLPINHVPTEDNPLYGLRLYGYTGGGDGGIGIDIPEPMTMALLGLGGLALLRRRRG